MDGENANTTWTMETEVLPDTEKTTFDEFALRSLESRSKRKCLFWRVASTGAFIFLLVIFLGVASSLNSNKQLISSKTPPCGIPTIRKEWRQLPIASRKAYLEAVQCLTTKPSKLNLTTSLYDDFTVAHMKTVYSVHHVPASLPWHRYFIFIYEQTLRNQCGYEGSLPYWDWALDSKKPLSSPVWDSEIGFGGNDSSETGCIQGGPLNNILLNYTANGPSQHCLKRNFSDSPIFGEMHSNEWTPEIIENIITTSNTYPEFRERIENGPHKHLHDGIGGEMPGISSTNDPLFFLHHAQIDRLWSIWQQQDPGTRLKEYNGRNNFGFKAKKEDILDMGGLGEEGHPVLHMLSAQNGLFCYQTT